MRKRKLSSNILAVKAATDGDTPLLQTLNRLENKHTDAKSICDSKSQELTGEETIDN